MRVPRRVANPASGNDNISIVDMLKNRLEGSYALLRNLLFGGGDELQNASKMKLNLGVVLRYAISLQSQLEFALPGRATQDNFADGLISLIVISEQKNLLQRHFSKRLAGAWVV